MAKMKPAMILAAGRGERMRPLTDHTPKPLLVVGGKPLIVWHIERLAAAGFNRIIINHAHLGQKIEVALGNGAAWGVSIAYSREAVALETAGGIATALPLIDDEVFPVINGDVYAEFDFARLDAVIRLVLEQGDLAHLVLVANPPHNPAGDFALAGSRVANEGAKKWTFAGIGVYHRRLFDKIAPGHKAPLAPLLREAIAASRVSGECFAGRWLDIGTPERLHQLDEILRTHV